MLILSDVHIGKSSHFRKNGIPVPSDVGQSNFWKLAGLIQDFRASEVLFLGDLSHSDFNKEWLDFVDMRMNFPNVQFRLVPGNHDLLNTTDYQEARIEVLPEIYQIGPFTFSHDALEKSDDLFNFSGHVHPAVKLRGSAFQSLRLPCFYFEEKKAVMPAFGDFTGKHAIRPKKNSRVFIITESKVISV